MLDKRRTGIPLSNYLNLGTLAVIYIDNLEFNRIRFDNFFIRNFKHINTNR